MNAKRQLEALPEISALAETFGTTAQKLVPFLACLHGRVVERSYSVEAALKDHLKMAEKVCVNTVMKENNGFACIAEFIYDDLKALGENSAK